MLFRKYVSSNRMVRCCHGYRLRQIMHYHLSVVTLGEIQAGIEITRERDAVKAAEIEAWLEQLAQSFQVLVVDAAVFRCWAKLMHHRNNHHLEDALLAATALTHDLTVVTRNTKDFTDFGVRLINPFLTPNNCTLKDKISADRCCVRKRIIRQHRHCVISETGC